MSRCPMFSAWPALLLFACAAPDKPAPAPDGQGTEIGDEGGEWPCAENSVNVTNLGEILPALGASPEALLAGAAGDFIGEGLRLSVAYDGGRVTFFDNEPAELERGADGVGEPAPPECLDLLAVEAEVLFRAPGLSLSTPSGWIAFGEGGGVSLSASVLVHEAYPVDPDDDEPGGDEGGAPPVGEATCETAPSTFSMDEMMRVELVLTGELAGDTWALQAKWMGDTLPMGDDAEVLSYEEPIWSGSAAAE